MSALLDPQIEIAAREWTVAPANAGGLSASCRIEDGWLLCEAAVPHDASDRIALLRKNAALPPPWKLVPGEGGLSLRAEFPAAEDDDTALLADSLDASFANAVARLNGGGAERAMDTWTGSIADLLALCAEAGWEATPRGNDRIAVRLECDEPLMALSDVVDGQLRVSMPFATIAGDGIRAQAAAELLLAAGALVRFVRPALRDETAGFEIIFASQPPTAAHLAEALSALSIAARIAAREAAAVAGDETVAGMFLAMRADASGICAPQTQTGG